MPSNTYKKNFLTEVIFKINFPSVPELAKEIPESLRSAFEEKLQILEPVKMSDIKLEATEEDVVTKREERTMWRFKNKEGDLFIELYMDYLAIDIKKYKNYSEFKAFIQEILGIFFTIYPELAINRLGLRYINQIQLDNKDLYQWSEYIDDSLISNIDFVTDKEDIRRLMTFMEIALDDDIRLRIQYGIFNSTYPGKLLKKEFVLDYDCFTEIQFERSKLEDKTDKFNDIVTRFFEKSIGSKLREVLNAD